ncbi:MAG: outer membrane lipoprotein carrier protein LolA [Flavobacteriales bacterium]|nr:outer membrane lipoprotein carrier protein LolA [Flavobacteriales bacterium]
MMFKNVLLALCLLFSAGVYAQFDGTKPVSDPESVKAKLEKSAAETQDIFAQFKQEKNLSVLEEVIESKGTFHFKKENKVRWNYAEPFKYLIIINGQKMYTNDEGKEKEYDMKSNKMFREINKIVVGTVQGNLFKSPDYKSEFLENQFYYHVKMVPADAKMREFLREIHLYFDKKDLTVSRLKMMEQGGDYTLVNFFGKKINEGISDSQFAIR